MGNWIGTDATGMAALGNGNAGIKAWGQASIIGRSGPGRNVISANDGSGIEANRNDVTIVIEGNHIGVASDGTTPLGNGRDGIDASGTSEADITGNTIAASGADGIHAGPNGTVTQNFVGTNADGDDLGNVGIGVRTDGDNNRVGGSSGAGNTVGFNGIGVYMREATNSTVEGNFVGTDAVAEADGDLLLSFDITVDLSGLVPDDEDLVRWDGASFTLALDASAAGIDEALDLDGAEHRGTSRYALSFDQSGMVDGINFDDEDVLELDGPDWSLIFDGSAEDSEWAAADMDALSVVPEPGLGALLGSGAAMLLGLQRRRLGPNRFGPKRL